jgi:hypothetical protein
MLQELMATADQDKAPPGDGRAMRIRAALGLRGSIRLPRVDQATLRSYFHYLAPHLCLPFCALYHDETGPGFTVRVLGLPHPARYALDPATGLLCTVQTPDGPRWVPLADIAVGEQHANHRLVEDYWYWFWNWR